MLTRLRSISAIAFLVVLLGGLASVVTHAVSHHETDIREHLTWQNAIDGKLTAAIDRMVNDAVPHSKQLNGWIDGLLFWSLGDAGPQVREGCQNWLYLAEELLEQPDGRNHLAARVELAEKIARGLAARNVKLVVLPVPDKAEIVRGELCGLRAAAIAGDRPRLWQEASAPLKLEQVDVRPGWPLPGYWRTDTHWNADGARHAARLVAEAIRRTAGEGGTDVRLDVSPVSHAFNGDLMKLANLVETSWIFGPPPDTAHDVSVQIERSGALLDDAPTPDTILAGSSYSLNSGFLDYLQAEASREIVQKSMAGGGFAGAMLDLLVESPDILDQVSIVVWEWPVRALTQPLSDQEKAFLAHPDQIMAP